MGQSSYLHEKNFIAKEERKGPGKTSGKIRKNQKAWKPENKKLLQDEHLESKCKKPITTLWHTDVDSHSDPSNQANLCDDSLVEHGRIVNSETSTRKNQRTDPKRHHESHQDRGCESCLENKSGVRRKDPDKITDLS